MLETQSSLECRARLEDLPLLLDFVDATCKRMGAEPEAWYAIRLAVEEVCTNLIKYGYADMVPGPIAIGMALKSGVISVTIRDRARAFDPAAAPPPNLSPMLAERTVGGLGWFLVKRYMDTLDYRSHDGENELTMTRVNRTRKGEGDGPVR